MKEIEYKNILVEIISMIKDKATYLKTIPQNNAPNIDFQKGQVLSYYQIIDSIVTYVKCSDDITLEELGLSDFDPIVILDYVQTKMVDNS